MTAGGGRAEYRGRGWAEINRRMNIPSISAALLVAAFLAGAGAAVSTVPPEPPDYVPPRRAADAFPPLPVGGLPSNVSVTTIGEGGGP